MSSSSSSSCCCYVCYELYDDPQRYSSHSTINHDSSKDNQINVLSTPCFYCRLLGYGCESHCGLEHNFALRNKLKQPNHPPAWAPPPFAFTGSAPSCALEHNFAPRNELKQPNHPPARAPPPFAFTGSAPLCALCSDRSAGPARNSHAGNHATDKCKYQPHHPPAHPRIVSHIPPAAFVRSTPHCALCSDRSAGHARNSHAGNHTTDKCKYQTHPRVTSHIPLALDSFARKNTAADCEY